MREITGSRLNFVNEWLNFDGLRGSANMTDQRGTGIGYYILTQMVPAGAQVRHPAVCKREVNPLS